MFNDVARKIVDSIHTAPSSKPKNRNGISTCSRYRKIIMDLACYINGQKKQSLY